MTARDKDGLPEPGGGSAPARPRSPAVLAIVMAAGGMAFAALLGLDGSPVWRLARVLAALTVTALAVWFTRRTGRAGRGAAASALGIVGAAAGTGVASGHLSKAGLDAAALLAAIVAVTGLFLAGWGAVALVRVMPGWWRLLAAPAAMVLLWFVLWPLTLAVYLERALHPAA